MTHIYIADCLGAPSGTVPALYLAGVINRITPARRNDETCSTRTQYKANPLFRWFARLYVQRIAQPGWLGDDEMGIAREVMLSLYEFAGRRVPEYFPRRPLEELYDSDLRAWRDVIRQHKVIMRRAGKETSIKFTDDLQPQEVQEYVACLPQTIKTRRLGRTLVIENPAAFHSWLDRGVRRWRWWERPFRR
jgi:hypothetical protein